MRRSECALRVYRIIADPFQPGVDVDHLEAVFDGDFSRGEVEVVVAAGVLSGCVLERDGLLFPAPYEDDADDPAEDEAFVGVVRDRLAAEAVPILYLHASGYAPPSVVVIDAEHWKRLLELVPESEEATALLMAHDHMGAE